MPYKVSWEPSGVVFRFSGVVSDEDLVASNEEVYASPLLPTMKYQVVDFSTIESFDASSATVLAISASDRIAAKTNPDVKVAIITSAAWVQSMTNLYSLYHESRGGSWTTEVFAHEDAARAWAVPSD